MGEGRVVDNGRKMRQKLSRKKLLRSFNVSSYNSNRILNSFSVLKNEYLLTSFLCQQTKFLWETIVKLAGKKCWCATEEGWLKECYNSRFGSSIREFTLISSHLKDHRIVTLMLAIVGRHCLGWTLLANLSLSQHILSPRLAHAFLFWGHWGWGYDVSVYV